jgi:hypothetical protein
MTMMCAVQANDLVTAAHRGTHTGVVLDRSDPRAWTDTLAFPGREPTREEVRLHLADCASRGISLSRRAPVRWCFGMTEWERVAALGPVRGGKCPCLQGDPAS